MTSQVGERVVFVSGGQRVVGVLHSPDRSEAKGKCIVITCHGLMSSKGSDKYLQIAGRFTSQGVSVLRFDFRGSGESEGHGNLLTNRVSDLKTAIEYSAKRGFKSIGILGSSYGGTTAIVTAAQVPRVGALVTWSTPCKLIGLHETAAREPRRQQARDRSRGEEVESEFTKDLSRYDVVEAARKVNKVLVVHCKRDKVVRWTQSKLIFDNALQPKQLKLFDGGDHQLTDPSIRKEAIELSLSWFLKYL